MRTRVRLLFQVRGGLGEGGWSKGDKKFPRLDILKEHEASIGRTFSGGAGVLGLDFGP